MRRRDFLALPATGAFPLRGVAASRDDVVEMRNRFYRVAFNNSTGDLFAWRGDDPFVTGGCVRAVSVEAVCASTDAEYRRSATVKSEETPLGRARTLIAQLADGRRRLDLEVRLMIFEERDILAIEVACRNVSRSALALRSLQPLAASTEQGGRCHWLDVRKTLSNGYMYFDPGTLNDFSRMNRVPTSSMWNICLYRGDRAPGLVIGYLENKTADGRVTVRYDDEQGKEGLSVTAESLFGVVRELAPGATARSGLLAFCVASDPFKALEDYAQAVGDTHRVKLNPIVNGWCNWGYTHEFFNEEEIVRNAEFASRRLKQYGLEFIQIDDGYQRAYGDWEGNERFPHGMKWLAGRILKAGLKPGIWIAPYVVGENSPVYQAHPEWLVRDAGGRIKQCGGGTAEDVVDGYGLPSFRRKLYGLDITHPGAAAWMHDLFRTIAGDWSYEMLKIDFVQWTLLAAARYHDPSFSKAAAYRRGFEVMRAAVGPSRHILDCGPAPNTIGLLDSTRINLDYPRLDWGQYTLHHNSNAASMAKRYYFHNRTWINDDDHLGVGLMEIVQARAAASIIALSGGTMMLSDRLFELPPGRLEILEKVLPSGGQAARPVDLFRREKPEIFVLPVTRPYGRWWLAALFNYDERATAEKSVDLADLGLDAAREYVACEFWTQQAVLGVRGQLRALLPPASVALYAVREATGTPQVISTDRHFMQGALELGGVEWDPAAGVLKGRSMGPAESHHSLLVYVPPPFMWEEEPALFLHDFPGYSVQMLYPGILRIRVRFEGRESVNWSLRFKQKQ